MKQKKMINRPLGHKTVMKKMMWIILLSIIATDSLFTACLHVIFQGGRVAPGRFGLLFLWKQNSTGYMQAGIADTTLTTQKSANSSEK
jgi:hypothetical protein